MLPSQPCNKLCSWPACLWFCADDVSASTLDPEYSVARVDSALCQAGDGCSGYLSGSSRSRQRPAPVGRELGPAVPALGPAPRPAAGAPPPCRQRLLPGRAPGALPGSIMALAFRVTRLQQVSAKAPCTLRSEGSSSPLNMLYKFAVCSILPCCVPIRAQSPGLGHPCNLAGCTS